MQTIPQTPANPEESLEYILSGSITALETEIKDVVNDLKRWGGDKPATIVTASLQGAEGDTVTYAVRLDRDIIPPEHAGVEVSADTQRVRGYVEGIIGGTDEQPAREILISLEKAVRGGLEMAEISFDATYVLRMMKGRLEGIDPGHDVNGNTNRLLGLAPVHVDRRVATHPSIQRAGLIRDQIDLIEIAQGSDLCLGFGPPGTGKTSTLGPHVAELAETRGLRVLITAHTNTALDTAMEKVVESLPEAWVSESRIVRSGRISREFAHLGISFEDVVKRGEARIAAEIQEKVTQMEIRTAELIPAPAFNTFRAVFARRKPAAKKRESLRDRVLALRERVNSAPRHLQEDPEVESLWRRINEVQNELESDAQGVEGKASVVGATLSKLAVEPFVFGMFDAVLIDEASMASLPQVIIASLHAKGMIHIFGDPCQLSPIVQSRDRKATDWLGRNVYQHLGLDDPALDDPRRPILLTQFRMAPDIRSMVSEVFYAGRLRDAPCVEPLGDLPGPNLILVDTSKLGCLSAKDGTSRINEGHAMLAAAITKALGEMGETDIGYITPFRAQMKLMGTALRHANPSYRYRGGWARTIHRSQGGEKDIIILDTVDAPPKMSSFLDASWNRDLPNLLDVACSRARKRLIIIAHTTGFRQKYGRRGLLIRILEETARRGAYISPERHEIFDEKGEFDVSKLTRKLLGVSGSTVS